MAHQDGLRPIPSACSVICDDPAQTLGRPSLLCAPCAGCGARSADRRRSGSRCCTALRRREACAAHFTFRAVLYSGSMPPRRAKSPDGNWRFPSYCLFTLSICTAVRPQPLAAGPGLRLHHGNAAGGADGSQRHSGCAAGGIIMAVRGSPASNRGSRRSARPGWRRRPSARS
jgi:hypothetical protein